MEQIKTNDAQKQSPDSINKGIIKPNKQKSLIPNTKDGIKKRAKRQANGAVKLRMNDWGKFKGIVTLIKDILDDISILFQKDSIIMSHMDITHILLFKSELKREFFDEYNFSLNGIGIANLKTKEFYKMIKNFKPSETSLKIEYKSNSDKISFNFGPKNSKRFGLAMINLPLTTIEEEDYNVPEYVPDIIINIKTADIYKIFTNIGVIDGVDQIKILKSKIDNKNEKTIKFIGEGGSGFCEVDALSYDANIKYNTNIDISIDYSFRLLKLMSHAQTISENVSISISTTYPIIFDYNIDEKSSDGYEEEEELDEEGNRKVGKKFKKKFNQKTKNKKQKTDLSSFIKNKKIKSFGYVKLYLAPKEKDDEAETKNESEDY